MQNLSDTALRGNENPILVFDKEGSLGELLVRNFARTHITVFVSGKMVQKIDRVLYVPFRRSIPKIPDSLFSRFYIIYTGDRRLLDLLPMFLQKAKKDNTQVFFVLSLREANEVWLRKLLDSYSLLKVILIGDIFGHPAFWSSPVNDLLWEARRGMVKLPEMGLRALYPVAAEDVIMSLTETAAPQTISEKILYILPPHPVTALSFARQLSQKEPLLKVDFTDKPGRPSTTPYSPFPYRSWLGDEYAYEQKVPLLDAVNESPADIRPLPEPKRSYLPFSLRPALIIIILWLATLPVLIPLLAVLLGGVFLMRSADALEKGNMPKSRTSAAAADEFFSLAQGTSGAVITILDVVGLDKQEKEYMDLVTTGKEAATVVQAGVTGVTAIQVVLSGKSLDPQKEMQTGIRELKYAISRLAVLEVSGKIPDKYSGRIQQIQRMSSQLTSLMDVVPVVMGMDKKRTYLVLLQNNMELRPGGGFIGSYAVLTVEKGQLKETHIQDVYSADGQLKEHIEPPYPLRRYLGASHWFMRDSNFDVDFARNAATVAYFYDLETGQRVDGVFAVDVSFARLLLSAIGPLYISEYNETVTAENFFLLTETYAQSDFFPGSTQKKDFLSAVYNAILLRFTEKSEIPYAGLADALSKGLAQKHIMVAFPDPAIQKVLLVNNVSSSLAENREEGAGRVHDFFGLNEANIGENKTNYYLDRAITQSILLHADGSASVSATVQYNNKSKPSSSFGGAYKNYLRFILPGGAIVQDVVIDAASQSVAPAVTDPDVFTARRFSPPEGLEVEQYEQAGKSIYGFLMTVPVSSKKTVQLMYSVPSKGGDEKTIHYSLRLFKQPGTEADPYTVSITYPANFTALSMSSGLKKEGQKLTWLGDLSEDRELTVIFTK